MGPVLLLLGMEHSQNRLFRGMQNSRIADPVIGMTIITVNVTIIAVPRRAACFVTTR